MAFRMKPDSVIGNLFGFCGALIISTIVLAWTPAGSGYFNRVHRNIIKVVEFMDENGSQQ